ncbi:hypothetical protein STEG23_030324 [Scotinomys teguina]
MAADPIPPFSMARSGTLNLNNEVVKMRKEVKRIRVLVIRKLVRSVGRLNSKKGSEDALLKNQRRAQRLLKEIHAMKELKPDVITKSALDGDNNFEKTCKKPDSTAAERAIARLAVHPLLKKKIDVLKGKNAVVTSAHQKAPADSNQKASTKTTKRECESTLGESSGGEEEKEYFDDSTEERFYKQSSASEDSDSGDDFFIGKVKWT